MGLQEKVYTVTQQFTVPFTLAELVIACHQAFPNTFSLEGFLQHPDSNKVISAISGKRGLVTRGGLKKIGPKLYERVSLDDYHTEAKRQERQRTIYRIMQVRLRYIKQTLPDLSKHLLEQIHGVALQAFRDSRTITEKDACYFWDVDHLLDFDEEKQSDIQTVLNELEYMTDQGKLPTITPDSIHELKRLHQHLLNRFACCLGQVS